MINCSASMNHEPEVGVAALAAPHYMRAQALCAESWGSFRFMMLSFCVCGGIAAVQQCETTSFQSSPTAQAAITCF